MELREIIKKLRGERSQAEFAESITAALPADKTVSKQAVSQWENGDTEPSDAVKKVLGIQTQYLLQ